MPQSRHNRSIGERFVSNSRPWALPSDYHAYRRPVEPMWIIC